jgi:hypothetical protein
VWCYAEENGRKMKTQTGKLLRVGSRYHVWIEGGVLHLPASVLLHPHQVCGKPLHIVTTTRGRKLTFVRAADVIAAAPASKESVTGIARRFKCAL